MNQFSTIAVLRKNIKACTICAEHLPFPPKPVFSFSQKSKILVVGQAPGTRVHESGIPWNDPSGDRLREWMQVSREQFYDTKYFSIVPMAFCYPGKGKSGDLPPRPECAENWMQPILDKIPKIKLILLIGQYSQGWFLKDQKKSTLTDTVKNWKMYLPNYFVLPHPSPRNNIWLKKNPWFEKQLVPKLRKKVKELIF
ncbi:MAG: uracil-DNA glycosylase family protein [Nitrospinota bacterium]